MRSASSFAAASAVVLLIGAIHDGSQLNVPGSSGATRAYFVPSSSNVMLHFGTVVVAVSVLSGSEGTVSAVSLVLVGVASGAVSPVPVPVVAAAVAGTAAVTGAAVVVESADLRSEPHAPASSVITAIAATERNLVCTMFAPKGQSVLL